MSNLVEIREQLQDTQAAIARVRRAMAAETIDAQSFSLLTSFKSLEKRQAQLERQFIEEANKVGVDVCSYRIFAEHHQPTISTVAGTLAAFQRLVSIVYDSMKSAKQRIRISAETEMETAFEFGYSFPGSVGIVFTLPNERMLPGITSALDDAMEIILNMSKATTPDELIAVARRLGTASVRALYLWAFEHVNGGCGAGIDWQRESDIRLSGIYPLADLQRLTDIISETSEEKSEQFTVSGVLLGADADPKRFHFRPDKGVEIRGTYEDAIRPDQRPELFKRYRATIKRTEVIHYSTEAEDVRYHLERLEDTGVRPYDSRT